MSAPAVTIRNLSISADETRILRNLDFDLADRSLTALVGPMGSGKSTLLTFLAGDTAAKGLLATFDQADFNGVPRSPVTGLCVIRQKQRTQERKNSAELLKNRLTELLERCKANPAPLCIDEPTAGLDRDDGVIMMETLREIATSRAVLVVTHKLDEVRKHCDHVVMIGDGSLVASLPAKVFFAADAHEHIRHFVQTGGLNIPREDAPVEHLSPDIRTVPEGFDLGPAETEPEKTSWILPDKLGLCSTESPLGNTSGLLIVAEPSALSIGSFSGEERERLTWESEDRRPDRMPDEIARICRMIDDEITDGGMVLIRPRGNLPQSAAIVGGFLIMRGFPPSDALDLVGRKFPELHLGMRLEQLLWDVDLAFSVV